MSAPGNGADSLLHQYKPYLEPEKDGRIVCKLNGHVMPATKQAIESFVNGAKFQRLKKKAEEMASFKKYEPFLLQSSNRSEKLFCTLTCMLINKSKDSIQRHMEGKAFCKAKEKFEKDEQELLEEPNLEDSQESGSEQRDDGEPENLVEGVEGMELDDGATWREAMPVRHCSRKQKKLMKRELRAKLMEDEAGPATPPQVSKSKVPGESAALAAEKAEEARSRKRLRANGSRPKRIKRVEE